MGIQRIKSILNKSTTNPKQMTLNDIIKHGNHQFPQFKSHQPTYHGINTRFKSILNIIYDESLSDYLISFKPKISSTPSNNLQNNQIPEIPLNKHYLSITISPQWMDPKL